jgi:hypothetical protein
MKPMKRNSEIKIIITLKLFYFHYFLFQLMTLKRIKLENENFRRNNIIRGALLQSKLQHQRNLFGNEEV